MTRGADSDRFSSGHYLAEKYPQDPDRDNSRVGESHGPLAGPPV